jgi:hypothetical protein
MPEQELVAEITTIFGPLAGSIMTLVLIAAWWFKSQKKESKDNGGREETRGNIREIKADVKSISQRIDRHLEGHAPPIVVTHQGGC